MSKKRRSLQALLIQPFTHTPISSPLHSPSISRLTSTPGSPTSPSVPPASAPVLGAFIAPPSLVALTGEGKGRPRTLSQSSVGGRNSKMMNAAQAAVNAIVRASHLGGTEDASSSDIITPDVSSLPTAGMETASASTSIVVPLASIPSSSATASSSSPHAMSDNQVPAPSRSSSPSSFLLDDDPFANLSPVAVGPKSRPSTSGTSTPGSIIPASERPKPIHPELLASLAMPSIPPTAVPKSRLQDDILEEEDDTEPTDQEMMTRGRTKDRADDDGKRKKSFLAAMSAPTSPSRGFFASRTSTELVPVPPLPPPPDGPTPPTFKPHSLSVPSSPKMTQRFPAPPPATRAFTNTRMQRPAHQRPAFIPRPSLPSLDTLARMNIVMAKKVRKGHVGAGLPFEPWDLPSDEEITTPLRRSPKAQSPVAETRSSVDSAHSASTPAPAKGPTSNEVLFFSEESPSDAPSSSSTSDRATQPTPTTPSLSNGPSPPSASSTEFFALTSTPQPFLPSQIVALGSFAAEDVEITSTGRTSIRHRFQRQSPPPRVNLTHASPPKTAAEMHAALVAPILPPLQPHEEFVVPIPKVVTPEPYQVAEILAAARSRSNSASRVQGDHRAEGNVLESPTHLEETLPPIDAGLEHIEDEPISRWSLETDEKADGQHSTSPTTSRSFASSRAGSSSDLSSTAYSTSPPYTYGYGYGYDDWNAEASSSSSAPLSRSLSLASSSSSAGDKTFDFGDSLSESLRESTSTYPDLDSSTSRTSTSNSFLHSPESEWQFTSEAEAMSFEPAVRPVSPNPLDISDVNSQTFDLAGHPQARFMNSIQKGGTTTLVSDQESFFQVAAEDQSSTLSSQHPTTPPHSNLDTSIDQKPKHSFSPSGDQTTTTSPETNSTASFFLPPSPTTARFVNHDDHDADNFFRSTEMASMISARPREKYGRSGGRVEHGGYPAPLPPSVVTSSRATNGYSSKYPSHTSPSPYNSHFASVNAQHGVEDDLRSQRRQLENSYSSGPTSHPTSDDDDFARYYTQTHNKEPTPSTFSPPISRSVSQPAVGHPAVKHRFPSSSITSATTSEDESSARSSSSDDDVPLAKRIPGALTAQKSIRIKVKEEKDAKRADRAMRYRERQLTLRPAGAGLASGKAAAEVSSSHEAAMSASAASFARLASPVHEPSPASHAVPRQRQRTMTMPSKPAAPPLAQLDFGQAFNPDDLAKKLQNVKMISDFNGASLGFSPPNQPLSRSGTHRRPVESNGRPSYETQNPSSPSYASPVPLMLLRSQRSFHRPSAVDHQPPEPRVPSHHSQELYQARQRSLSVSRSDRERKPQTYEEPVPPLPLGLSNRPSVDETERRVLKKPFDSRLASGRTSSEVEQDRYRRPSVGNASVNPQTDSTTKQCVFVHSLQHHHLADIGPTTTAGDLIAACEKEGVLDGWAGVGSWLVWEIAQDFGMERPVRDFEQLADVQASWLKDKTVNYFLLKKSDLASSLSRSAIPPTAPTHSGYVEWESKRGKWSKRWLRLKENALYISKRDNGRDETLLCSLSNFDAYYITRSQRSPKAFAFAVKSTDNLSFFENTADYMHNLSCSQKDGQAWMEKILIARSFVLHEERQVLFNPRVPNTQSSLGASLSRSGTRKTAGGRQQQPFLALPSSDVFQPGSLLSQPGL